MDVRPADKAVLRLAMALVKGAYEEAMRTHGLLPGTIALVSAQAERNLAVLDDTADGS
ncbi:hypothetical protein ACSNOI_09225 [Actinomadura kijaniata]|uniref:hypothetical protein n=1 Tax=Actinomadura kijaniata TaxID=46161 RepID=UPI003F1A6F2C